MADAHDSDCLHRFDFEHLPIRGLLIHMDASWTALHEHREYPPLIQKTLGESVVAAVLLAATIKFDGQLTFQLKGDGPMHLLLAQCTAGLGVRGLARFRATGLPMDNEATLQNLVGEGHLTVTLESEDLQQRYQGVVPIMKGQLAQCLEAYFEQSEQLPTRLWLHADERGVSGMLLQRLPVSQAAQQTKSELSEGQGFEPQYDDDWHRLQMIADTLKPEELNQLADRDILRRLFSEDDLRLFDSMPVYFKCRCSRERVSGMLQTLGHEEAASVLAEQGKVEVLCDFCNRAYVFDALDVAQLFSGSSTNLGTPQRH